jgi:hypothetical protein
MKPNNKNNDQELQQAFSLITQLTMQTREAVVYSGRAERTLWRLGKLGVLHPYYVTGRAFWLKEELDKLPKRVTPKQPIRRPSFRGIFHRETIS